MTTRTSTKGSTHIVHPNTVQTSLLGATTDLGGHTDLLGDPATSHRPHGDIANWRTREGYAGAVSVDGPSRAT